MSCWTPPQDGFIRHAVMRRRAGVCDLSRSGGHGYWTPYGVKWPSSWCRLSRRHACPSSTLAHDHHSRAFSKVDGLTPHTVSQDEVAPITPALPSGQGLLDPVRGRAALWLESKQKLALHRGSLSAAWWRITSASAELVAFRSRRMNASQLGKCRSLLRRDCRS